MSIISLLNQIHENEVVLPAIQRDFVWSDDRIYMLLDSIMRGYPIGMDTSFLRAACRSCKPQST